MKNFTGDRRGGGFRGGDRGGKGGFKKPWENKGGFDRPQVMHKATCGECGKSCEVPFRPTGEKPVFCNDCFNSKRDPSDTRGSSRSDFSPKRDFNDRFAPRADARPLMNRPVSDNTGKQLAEISMKLDRLIVAMERITAPKAAPAPVAKTEKVRTSKPVTKAKVKKVVAKKKPAKK